jgi:hypothetical protein
MFAMKQLIPATLVVVLSGCSFFLHKDDPNKASNSEMKLHYKNAAHEEVNSFQGYVRKETKPLYYAETKFELGPSQQLLILNRAFLAKFFEMPAAIGTLSAGKDTNSLRIASGVLDWTVKWTASTDELRASGSKLPELLTYVDSTLHATHEYQILPKRE